MTEEQMYEMYVEQSKGNGNIPFSFEEWKALAKIFKDTTIQQIQGDEEK